MTNSLTLSSEEVQRLLDAGEPHVVRLLVQPGQTVAFTDSIRGSVSFESGTVDDQVLVKSDGLPTYHLANIVDDHKMGITHVIRGEEWLPSTPKHILLYEALDWTAPQMAHLPLILSPTGGKLSKRNAEKQGIPVSVHQYRDAGYEPEALINFLAMLGWNPGDEREVFSLEDLVSAFSIERVGQAGVQFDLQKLKWFNEQFLRARSPEDIAKSLLEAVQEKFGEVSEEYLVRAITLMKDRMSFELDALEASYLFTDPSTFDEKAVQKRWKESFADNVRGYADQLERLEMWKASELEALLKSYMEENGIGMGAIMFPVRMTLTGQPSGPDLYPMMELLGKDAVIRRLRQGAEVLG